MKYPYTVKFNGEFYPTGTNVPVEVTPQIDQEDPVDDETQIDTQEDLVDTKEKAQKKKQVKSR